MDLFNSVEGQRRVGEKFHLTFPLCFIVSID
jgi:hypothetical protein